MQNLDGRLTYSPTDLIKFLESPFSSWMDRCYLEHPEGMKPDEDSEERKLVAQTGDRHEKKFLKALQEKGPVTTIPRSELGVSQTIEAIRRGDDVIYQAFLELAPFRGYADFLKRYGAGDGGQPLYEVWDTKLARKTKPYYLVQLCCYAEMLASIQGVLPPKVRVALGSGDMPEYATGDFFYYYRELKAAFLRMMDEFDPKRPPEPDPRADHGRWSSHAQAWLEERDHLVLVANINSSQIKKLNQAGISTVAGLAAAGKKKIPRLSDEIYGKLAEQARLQVETRELRKADPDCPPSFRILEPGEPNQRRGLALLPPPCPADVFFDMEGFPLADHGLEYLFGASIRGPGGKPEFLDWWAHDEVEEKAAFEGFIDWAHARWKENPSLHIYHYAAYEVSAVRRLMGRHGTREDKVDELLRNEVFVDLYQVVRQGLRVGEPSYSIKSIEHLYRGKRSGDVATAGESMVYYANWMESGEPRKWEGSPILRKIRDYNRDDCESTVQLYDWLCEHQKKAGIAYVPPVRPEVKEAAAEALAAMKERADLIASLEGKIAREQDPELKRLHTFFLQILEFHRREAKPSWWRVFSRMTTEPEELMEDLDCIAGARLSAKKPRQEKRSMVFTYSFDPNQDTKIREKDRVYAVPSTAATFEIVRFDEGGELDVKIGIAKLDAVFGGTAPANTSFIPNENVPDNKLRDSVQQVIDRWVKEGVMPPALGNFLRREPPKIRGGAPLSKAGEDIEAAAIRCALNMRDSTLCLQGPPGTGKTTTAAGMILALVDAGKSVGITSNSHKAIENLLRACVKAGGAGFSALKVGDDPMADCRPQIVHSDNTNAHGQFAGGVVGGTAWLFSRPEWVGELDHLFVDEAGQVSLGNLVAMSRSADNIILLGDQMQLEQPIQGSHPGETGQSTLNYYLQDHATIPDDLGLFLPVTYRLPPGICQFISEMIYEGRLKPAPANANRRIISKGKPEGAITQESGLAFLPVSHEGNVQASDEEADAIRTLISQLVKRTKIDDAGKPAGPLRPQDIMVVAPYNMQVRRLREQLHADVPVASVDKFQGQEAEIVIFSMCSSFGEYGSRGLAFILDQNRLNVAISRARTLAVVVGDPRIATSGAGSIPEMRRLNLYCRLVQDYCVTRRA